MTTLAKRMQDLNAQINNAEAPPLAPVKARSSLAATTQLLNGTAEMKQLYSELDALKRASGAGTSLKLSALRPSPYQVGGLDEERVCALVDNLRVNPLNSPIVVREVSPGAYEMLAGHHRVEAYRRLEREEIFAVVVSVDDDHAERLVFYDNLFAPQLSDFAKYLGFAARRASRGLSYEQLAEEAGISKTQVVYLMSFSQLPESALRLLEGAPKSLSYHGAKYLASLLPAHEADVVEAVKALVEGQLKPGQLEPWLSRRVAGRNAASDSTKPAPVVIKAGKQRYATVTRRAALLSVKFSTEESAQQAQSLIEELLRKEAASARS